MVALIELTGKRFGRLTVVKRSEKQSKWVHWTCLCDCGIVKPAVRGGDLRSGRTVSCGCYRIERVTKHGFHNTKIYQVWADMLHRCRSVREGTKTYSQYRGRGITVCRRWLKFKNFLADMQESYQSGLSLDRKNNNGNYTKRNCHWATHSQQMRNRRKVSYEGRCRLSEAAKQREAKKRATKLRRIRAGSHNR